MQLWSIIAQLSRAVVENGNVYLNISLNEEGLSIQLLPLFEEGEEDEEE